MTPGRTAGTRSAASRSRGLVSETTTLAIALPSARRLVLSVLSGPDDELAYDRCPPHRRAGLRQHLRQVGPHCANSAPITNAQRSRSAASEMPLLGARLHGRRGRYPRLTGAASAKATEQPFRKTAMPGHVLRRWRVVRTLPPAIRPARTSVSRRRTGSKLLLQGDLLTGSTRAGASYGDISHLGR
jgi:hypothetical protein